jgi:uncharacterized membrane protein YgdD (TMEM256/DUF423 family)
MDKTFLSAAAIFGFVAVALGAFSTHSLASYFEKHPRYEDNYKTATLYLMFHVAGLIAVAWANAQAEGTWFNVAGYAFIIGILLFSGSLYVLSLTGIKWLGAITPLGGVAFLVGWASLLLGTWKS